MNPVVAVIAIGVIAIGMVIMLGAVQTHRTRVMTRRRLDEAIPDMEPSHVMGTVSHNATNERVRRATGDLDVSELQRTMDQARELEEHG